MKTQKVKPIQKAAKEKPPKNCRDYHFTRITISPKKENRKNHLYVYISSRSEGVAFSQEQNIKKSIIAKIEPKKMQSQVNFTEYSHSVNLNITPKQAGRARICVGIIKAVKL